MTSCHYTPRQIEALAWLPKAGGWKNFKQRFSQPMQELRAQKLVGASAHWNYVYLTPSGIAERARLVEIGAIK